MLILKHNFFTFLKFVTFNKIIERDLSKKKSDGELSKLANFSCNLFMLQTYKKGNNPIKKVVRFNRDPPLMKMHRIFN